VSRTRPLTFPNTGSSDLICGPGVQARDRDVRGAVPTRGLQDQGRRALDGQDAAAPGRRRAPRVSHLLRTPPWQRGALHASEVAASHSVSDRPDQRLAKLSRAFTSAHGDERGPQPSVMKDFGLQYVDLPVQP
jgi:hypothetical protein